MHQRQMRGCYLNATVACDGGGVCMREGTHNNLHAPTGLYLSLVRRIKLFQWGDAFHMRVVVVRLGITPSSVDPSEHSHSVWLAVRG